MKATVGQVSEYFSFDFEKIDGFEYSVVKTNKIDILNGHFDIGVLPLFRIPILDSPMVIAALSERIEARVCFFIRPISLTGPGAFGFAKSSKVYSDFPFYLIQMKAIRPDIQVIQNQEEADLIVGHFELEKIKGDFSKFYIHPAEITPLPGSGVMACLVRKENLELRKKLIAVHHDEVAKLTNVERKISHLLGKEGHGVNIYTDQNSYFHLNLAVMNQGETKRVKISSSTLINLEKEAIEALKIPIGN